MSFAFVRVRAAARSDLEPLDHGFELFGAGEQFRAGVRC